jgi:hypothetical protein
MNRSDRDDALLNAIAAAESESYGSGDGSDGTLASERADAINAYLGVNTMPAPDGQTQLVSRDVFDAIEWVVPGLVRIFAGSDEVVKFQPVGPEDEQSARQESLYLNHVVTQRTNWVQVLHDWVKDALLTRNAYCMAWWDDARQVEYERYAAQSDEAFAMLVDEDGVEVMEHTATPDEDESERLAKAYAVAVQRWQAGTQQMAQQWQQAAMQAQQAGQPAPPEPEFPPQPPAPPQPMLHAVKIRRTRTNGKVCLRALPPERCVIHQSTSDYTLENADFFQYWEECTISKVRAMGFDIPDDIADDSGGTDGETEEDQARDRFGETFTRNSQGYEPSMRKVTLRMTWIRHDYDDDGIAEMQYVLSIGNTLLYREECNRIPVASIVAVPVPHRHIGISLYDVTGDIQEAKTAMLRQGVDNLFHANNPRLFINDGKINLDDALVSQPGGVVRSLPGTDAVFGRDIAPISIPNVFPQAVQGMEYMDRLGEKRTGVNGVFSGNVSPEVLTQTTGMALSQMGGAAAQKMEQMARMIAPSVEYLFSCVHELILKHGHKKETLRLGGQWVQVDPASWRTRRDLKLAVGLGTGNKDALLGHLNQMFQMQMALMPMQVTTPALVYNTASEISKAAGFGSPDLFWQRPPPPQPQGPPPDVMLQKMKQEFEAQQADADRRFEAQKLQIEQAHEQRATAAEQSFAMQQQRITQAFEAWVLQIEQGTKAEIATAHEETARTVAEMRAMLEQQKMAIEAEMRDGREESARLKTERSLLGELGGALEALASRIDGTRTVAIERVRGPDGRMIGGRVIQADGTARDVNIGG